MPQCSIANCTKPARARGWCRAHYTRWDRYGDPIGTATPKPVAERFWERVAKTDGCWEWTGAMTDRGYGRFRVEGRKFVPAYRWAWEDANGPLPLGTEPDHLCRNHACVRPDHLEPVPHRVNVLRGTGPTAVNAERTECQRGHPFDAENTMPRPEGGRRCRACHRARSRAWISARRAAERV